jgi:ribosomal protein S18 acetylase RimI-like enzyme
MLPRQGINEKPCVARCRPTDVGQHLLTPETLPPFPIRRAALALVHPEWTVRPATSTDLQGLCALYALWRTPEFALLPWSYEECLRVAADQFAFQHRQFVERFPRANFCVIEDKQAHLLGRVYLDRSTRKWHLIDVLLAEEARGRGYGTDLLRLMQHMAAASVASIYLHVAANNTEAQRLYTRLGFTFLADQSDVLYRAMRWSPDARVQDPQVPFNRLLDRDG